MVALAVIALLLLALIPAEIARRKGLGFWTFYVFGLIFWIGAVVGFYLTVVNPVLESFFISPPMRAAIEARRLWTEVLTRTAPHATPAPCSSARPWAPCAACRSRGLASSGFALRSMNRARSGVPQEVWPDQAGRAKQDVLQRWRQAPKNGWPQSESADHLNDRKRRDPSSSQVIPNEVWKPDKDRTLQA